MDGLVSTSIWLIYEAAATDRHAVALQDEQGAHARLRFGKSLGLLMAGLMFLGSLSPAALARGRWGDIVYVNTPPGYALNVRWGPSTSNGIYRKVRRGSALELSGAQRNGWLQLTDQTWVAGNLVSSRPPFGFPIDGLPNYNNFANYYYVVTPQYYALNIRQGPGKEYQRLGQFDNGTLIRVTGRTTGNWAQLPNGSWVDRTYLVAYNGQPPPPRPSPNPTTPVSDPVIVELQLLLRQVGYLPSGFVPNGIYDRTTQDAVIRFQRANGLNPNGVVDSATWEALYEAARPPTPKPTVTVTVSPTPTPTPTVTVTVTPTPSPTATTPTPTPTATGGQRRVVTDGEDTLVFAGPGPEYELLRTIPNGTIVTITGKTNGNWSELADGGWVFSLWLEPV
jgi:peptidoglycan hydrolase-like protein with peptidoglycan-binding domain